MDNKTVMNAPRRGGKNTQALHDLSYQLAQEKAENAALREQVGALRKIGSVYNQIPMPQYEDEGLQEAYTDGAMAVWNMVRQILEGK